jgi:hypothetical protein
LLWEARSARVMLLAWRSGCGRHRLETRGGEHRACCFRMGGPDGEILALAEGSRGLDGVKRVHMVSVSDSVVHHAHCPALVVGAEEE